MIIVHSQSHAPSFNLAFEEYLFTESQENYLLFYVNEPCVVLGSNQALTNEVDVAYCEANNIKIIRRKSGGGTVYHDTGNLNFSFISSKEGEKNNLSGEFLIPIKQILSKLNIESSIGERKDLWLNGEFKISGTASQIRKNRTLHHGTLLINSDLTQLQLALSAKNVDETIKATKSVRSTTTNIFNYLDSTNSQHLDTVLFINCFINEACQYFKSKLVTNNDFDMKKIQPYETLYNDMKWNLKK